MEEERFLVVELPDLRTPFVAFTARHPGCTTEMVLMPREADGEKGLTATFLVNGLRASAAAELRRLVAAAYPGLSMWQPPGSSDAWLGRFSFAARELTDRTAQAIISFLQERPLAESWVRTAEGKTSFRIHVPATGDAPALADALRKHLAAAGASGQVHVMTSRPSPGWRDLVQESSKAG